MKKLRTVILYFIFMLISFVTVYPVILVILLSVQDSDELAEMTSSLIQFTGEYVDIHYIPQYPTLSHFIDLLIFTPEFYTVFWNSLLMTGIILVFQLLVAVPSAWAFASFRFKGKKLLFNMYVIFMLMPFQVTMLSQYIVLDKIQLMNTRWSVILPAIFSTFSVFLIYRGFADIPRDIADSARTDGANEWQVLRYIGLPLGKHGILSCLVLSFLDYWNMVEQPLAFINDKSKFPLSLYLPMLDMSNAELMLTSSVITLVPAVFVFITGQDYLEQGIISSSLKE
ncbi:MAG: carbohydrate ABC transporter permease [Oscillospiraceae bacterium]|nr:carbohydrate ABC transporter permease [Ruminococcus sp.]MBP1565534.1 carbohydrate ABC transporter permease [Oscillospiraceae bacterium]MBQ9982115.1 carbohydrate ABC transporter permease [Oscillospiraceae bacterium]